MKLANINSIKDRVIVKVPGDFNKFTKENLELEWKRLDVDETKEILEGIRNETVREDDVIEDSLINVVNLKDEEGNDLPFNTELLHKIMNINYIRKSIIQSFMNVQIGREALKAKN